MVALLDRLPLGAHRATPVEQVHLTLQFVGDTPSSRVEGVVETVRRAAGGIQGFELIPLRLITLPARGSARLAAIETDAPPPLLELQRRLASRLARRPRKETGDGFLPHLTLCRFREGAQAVRVEETVGMVGFRAPEVLVMRSVLRPAGSEHAEVARIALES